MNETTVNWMNGSRLDEVNFCREFRRKYPMIYTEGSFFGVDGRIHNLEALRHQVYLELAPYVSSNLARKVEAVMGTLRLECGGEEMADEEIIIHPSNGTYNLINGFSTYRDFCRHRLPVAYNPEAKEPVTWLKFLDDLLEPEDIETLQEFMGYCLVPTNLGQKMLMIIGRGGEGKSRIGIVMHGLLGENMCNGNLSKVENNAFARADLQHKLLMVDDDLKMEALNQASNIKALVTTEQPMDLERKGVQSYQGRLFCRFMAFGNGTLQTLHDRSHGFFRRQIILKAKPVSPQRVDDPYMGKRLLQEIEGIFLWTLEGLYRLLTNDFQFTLSKKAQENLRESIMETTNAAEFLESTGYFRYGEAEVASSRSLYGAYRRWCEDNALTPLGSKTFIQYLKSNADQYHLHWDKNIPIGNGLFARGFRGIRTMSGT